MDRESFKATLPAYLFWSSWRRQTNVERWNLQERRVLDDGSKLALHRRHNFTAAPESIGVGWVGGWDSFVSAALRCVRALLPGREREREREREEEDGRRLGIALCSALLVGRALSFGLLSLCGLNQNRAGPLVSHSLRFFSSFLLPAHPLVAPAQQGRDGAQRRRLLIARSPAASSTSTASALPQDLEDYAPAHDADADPIPFPK
jgi:hypothetical protein